MQNHVIDPTFFNDAIEEFAFNYCWYVNNGKKIDDEGKQINTYEKRAIRGSLQSEGTSITKDKTGNKQEWKYNFYCKSLYRIKDGDFIFYNGKYLIITGYSDFDEWGVRSCELTMVNLNSHKDLKDYIKYLEGDKII